MFKTCSINDGAVVLEDLLSQVENYADSLRALVEARTADYLEEKRKCET